MLKIEFSNFMRANMLSVENMFFFIELLHLNWPSKYESMYLRFINNTARMSKDAR